MAARFVFVCLFVCFGHVAHEILVPQPGIQPVSPALEDRVLTIGQAVNFLKLDFFS